MFVFMPVPSLHPLNIHGINFFYSLVNIIGVHILTSLLLTTYQVVSKAVQLMWFSAFKRIHT